MSVAHKDYMNYCKYVDRRGVSVLYKKLDSYLWVLGYEIKTRWSGISFYDYGTCV